MNLLELKDQIMHNTLSNFYIFTGTEIGIMNIYLQQMSNTLSLPITRADSVASVYGRCMGGSLFGDDLGFYVIREDKDFPKHDEAFSTISGDIGKNVIVLLYDKVDSRLKFGKFFKDQIVTFEKLTSSVLKSYIKKAINLSDANIELLMQLCGNSYDMCMLEIDKIKQYCKAIDDTDYNYYFQDLLNEGVIYQPEEADVFKFTEAVCTRKSKLAFDIEEVLRNNNTSSVVTLGTLYNSMKSVLLIQCCENNDIAGTTGLDKGQIYFNRKYVGNYSDGELVSAIKLLSNVISGIKNGWIDDSYATKYALVNIL